MYQAGHLAVVHAAGSPDPNRSHFEAMRRIETATPNQPGPPERTGWLGRYIAGRAPTGAGALRGLALDPVMPQTLVGGTGLLPTYTAEGFAFPGPTHTATARSAALQAMYAQASIPDVRDAGANALAATAILQGIDFANYVPSAPANYPSSLFATRLRNSATILKSSAPIEVIEIDYGAWDHHDNQGPLQGTMAQMLDDLCRSLRGVLPGRADRAESDHPRRNVRVRSPSRRKRQRRH